MSAITQVLRQGTSIYPSALISGFGNGAYRLCALRLFQQAHRMQPMLRPRLATFSTTVSLLRQRQVQETFAKLQGRRYNYRLPLKSKEQINLLRRGDVARPRAHPNIHNPWTRAEEQKTSADGAASGTIMTQLKEYGTALVYLLVGWFLLEKTWQKRLASVDSGKEKKPQGQREACTESST